ncbi:serine O-acetyltransferase [soil metagenome]
MILRRIKENIDAIYDQDPAARSRLEVILCYPGFHAVTMHQLSHMLWTHELHTLARCVSHFSRVSTGIEIHPGATLGRRVFIDHGMGVVIGETTIIGDDVTIYQGVTLGAGAAARMGSASRGTKRHPTLGNGVVVGSGAEIQGDIMVGDNVRIASGSILLKDVPDNSVVVGVPGRVIYRDGQKVKDEVPDIEAEAIKSLKDKVRKLEKQLQSVTACIESLQLSTPVAPVNEEEEMPTSPTSTDPVDVFLHGAGI